VDEILTRFGTDPESADRLAAQAAMAESVLGIHGVSTTARRVAAAGSRALRSVVKLVFPVRETPSRRDPLHRTVELPKPVTPEVAEAFNRLFGRG